MGNRPHPHRRQDNRLIYMSDAEFEEECDKFYLIGTAIEQRERAERIRMADESPEQADWESDEEGDED